MQEKGESKEEAEWLNKEIKRIMMGKAIKVIAIDEEMHHIAGICDVCRKEPLEAHGHNIDFGLGVRKEYRRKGIGTKLLKKGIEIAKEVFNAQNIWIEVVEGNKVAYHLYKKLGFKEVARLKNYVNHFRELKDKIIMKLEI